MKLDRHRQIQELLRSRGECSVEFLAAELGVSEMTIRRDLQQLADENRLVRAHGGASPVERVSFEFQFLRDARQFADEKEAIGLRAAALVEDGQSILFDSGTTTLAVARQLAARRRLVVITSSLPIAAVLQRSSSSEVILLGGIVRRDAPDLAGPLAEANLDAFRADVAFVGADGVGLDGELYNASLTVGRLIAKMTTRAGSVYVVADSSKIGRTALSRFGNAKQLQGLITDAGIARGDRRALERAGVRVLIAEAT
jgi:DeoR/GlpR family transcriptional regulator of sugar metabolism